MAVTASLLANSPPQVDSSDRHEREVESGGVVVRGRARSQKMFLDGTGYTAVVRTLRPYIVIDALSWTVNLRGV